LTVSVFAQSVETPMQAVVEQEAQRLKSSDFETRFDAVHKLRLMENAVAARAAATALDDDSENVRAAACETVAFLANEDAALFLTPLLNPKKEKSEFVRREAAFALGEAISKTAVPALIQTLQTDKKPSVRAAAAIALGNIADERALQPLANVLLLPQTKKNNRVVDEFVRRSAAKSLGQIRRKEAVPALITALRDTNNAADIRRESAFALGLIADQSAAVVLKENLNAEDYLLAEIAANALQRIKETTEDTKDTEKTNKRE
jgi:HEAT repeat protein